MCPYTARGLGTHQGKGANSRVHTLASSTLTRASHRPPSGFSSLWAAHPASPGRRKKRG